MFVPEKWIALITKRRNGSNFRIEMVQERELLKPDDASVRRTGPVRISTGALA